MAQDAATLAVPVVILLLFLLRSRGKRKRIRIERMWIGPALIVILTGAVLWLIPPPLDPVVYGVFAAALGVGAGIGWLRGRVVGISIDPVTHALTSQTSAMGLILLLGVFVVRYLVRQGLGAGGDALHLTPATLTDAFLLLAVGMIVTRRLVIWRRCEALLQEARWRGKVVEAEAA